MRLCDLSLPTPEENLACDEVLLDLCEAGQQAEVLRLWEPAQYFVVVGYANRASSEVNLEYCRQKGIPVLRRCSGGGTVLQGPGCLNYSLILNFENSTALKNIHSTNEFVMKRHREMLSEILGKAVEQRGHTDLAVGGLKVSGNAQRRKKRALIFHGCFLLNLGIHFVEQVLPMPSKMPDYRSRRSHADFLMNLELPGGVLKEALCRTWAAREPLEALPLDSVRALAREKYSSAEWNMKF